MPSDGPCEFALASEHRLATTSGVQGSAKGRALFALAASADGFRCTVLERSPFGRRYARAHRLGADPPRVPVLEGPSPEPTPTSDVSCRTARHARPAPFPIDRCGHRRSSVAARGRRAIHRGHQARALQTGLELATSPPRRLPPYRTTQHLSAPSWVPDRGFDTTNIGTLRTHSSRPFEFLRRASNTFEGRFATRPRTLASSARIRPRASSSQRRPNHFRDPSHTTRGACDRRLPPIPSKRVPNRSTRVDEFERIAICRRKGVLRRLDFALGMPSHVDARGPKATCR